MFYNEPRCDCRRVFLSVTASLTEEKESVIACGWDGRTFYRNRFKSYSPTKEKISELQRPMLNPGSPQSSSVEAVLELFTILLLPDSAFMARVKTPLSTLPRQARRLTDNIARIAGACTAPRHSLNPPPARHRGHGRS